MAAPNKIAWITGGGSGIGFGGAQALAAEGWRVVISGRRAEVLDEAVRTIRAAGGDVSAAPMDVGKAADAERVAQAILAEHGRIDLLVNSAGVNVPKRSWAEI